MSQAMPSKTKSRKLRLQATVKPFIESKTIRKIIVVRNIVNIVV